MASKTGISQIVKGRADLYKVDPRDIHVVDGFNARNFDDPDNAEHIENLAMSIAEIGVKTPLRVRYNNGQIELVDGECRLRATMLAISRGAEILTVPVITEDRYANDADLVLSQLTSNSGKNFTPIEKAAAFKRLIGFGWSEADIAKKSGMTKIRVMQLLELSAAPAEVAQMVSQGKVSASLAIETLRDAPDAGVAVETLQAGLADAERAGKTRATKKNVMAAQNKPKMSMKMQRDRLLDLLRAALANRPDHGWIKQQLDQFQKEAGIEAEGREAEAEGMTEEPEAESEGPEVESTIDGDDTDAAEEAAPESDAHVIE